MFIIQVFPIASFPGSCRGGVEGPVHTPFVHAREIMDEVYINLSVNNLWQE